MTGSKLYQEAMAYYESRPDQDADLQHQVWDGTPWITEVYIGAPYGGREQRMFEWCLDRFGEMARPFGKNPLPGQWRAGNAIVRGWAWFGFATEQQMKEFAAAWPSPQESNGE